MRLHFLFSFSLLSPSDEPSRGVYADMFRSLSSNKQKHCFFSCAGNEHEKQTDRTHPNQTMGSQAAQRNRNGEKIA